MSIDDVIVVTTDNVPGYRVVRVIGLVSASSARARGLGRDITAGIRNILGGSVVEYKELLEATRDEALRELREKAKKMGANAVVGVRLTTSMIAQGVAEVVWYGTAVVVEPV
ncbi:MAG: YbjQ family protein [Desulfurococcales archaeon]|nr:YbjQ family protein [Desulfurococcales archaeon]